MQLISEWLATTCGSHTIQNAEKLQTDYRLKTGKADILPSLTVTQARAMIEARGLGGWCNGDPSERVCNGWEVAEFLAGRYGSPKDTRWKIMEGRGFIFDCAVESIAKAEKEAAL